MKLYTSIIICITAIALYHQAHIISLSSTAINQLQQATSHLFKTAFNNTTHMSSNTQNTTTAFKGLPVVPPNDPSLTKDPAVAVPRAIKQSFLAVSQAEGAGARVRRSIGTPKLRNFSPFLMLDHFTIPPGAGFSDHPHAGMETITYLLSGGVDHEDFTGSKGTIGPGDLQFMTAGRGIVHAEMPHGNPDGTPDVGMQLWVDLPQALKKCEPRYRDLRASEIPLDESKDGKVKIKVISGQTANGVLSHQELSYTPVWYLDITMQPGSNLTQPIPAGWNAFAYSLAGTVTFGSAQQARTVSQYHNTVFEQDGDTVVAQVDADAGEDARFILVAGLPLDQPVVQYGPFVVSSTEEVYQAMRDFQRFENGFERARGWESEIGKRLA